MTTYALIHPRTFFVELNESTYEGFTASGIQILKKDFILTGTWKNTGRVICTNECRDVKMNDLVIFRKHSHKNLGASDGVLRVLSEQQVLGVVRRKDGSAWFSQ